MATVSAPPPASSETPVAPEVSPPAPTPAGEAPPTWEHLGNRGDYLAVRFWLLTFALMVLMVLLDLLLGIFR